MLPQDYATRIQARFRGGVTRQNQTLANLRQDRITSRSAYKSYINAITIKNPHNLLGGEGLDLLLHCAPSLRENLRKHKGIRYHVSTLAHFYRPEEDGPVHEWFWLNPTPLESVLQDNEVYSSTAR